MLAGRLQDPHRLRLHQATCRVAPVAVSGKKGWGFGFRRFFGGLGGFEGQVGCAAAPTFLSHSRRSRLPGRMTTAPRTPRPKRPKSTPQAELIDKKKFIDTHYGAIAPKAHFLSISLTFRGSRMKTLPSQQPEPGSPARRGP